MQKSSLRFIMEKMNIVYGTIATGQNMIPQQAYMTANYCNKEGVSFKNLPEGQLNGLIRLQIRYNLYNKAFRDGDTRKDATRSCRI